MPYWKRAQVEVAKRLGGDKLDALIAMLAEVESLHPIRSGRAALRNYAKETQ
jgi:hypothetical protein